MIKAGIRVSEWRTCVFSKSEWLRKSLWPYYRIRRLKPMSGNSWNAIFRADSVDGALCLKVLNEHTTSISLTVDELAYVARLMSIFARIDGLTVSCPVPGTDGRSTHRIGEYCCIVYPWIEMKGFVRPVEDAPQTQAVAAQAARMLAKLHEYARSYGGRLDERPCTQLYAAYSVQMWYAHLDEIWRMCEELMQYRTLTREGRDLMKEARCMCDEFVSRAETLFNNQASQHIVLHGDYRPENMAMSMCQVALWDFDFAHHDIPETEVAYAALSFSGPRFFLGSRSWENVEAFISTYREASDMPLSVELCKAALEWQVIRAMSLSFDEGQLRKRMHTYKSLRQELSSPRTL